MSLPSTTSLAFPRDVPTLTDGVVTLRAHTADDVEALYEQALDPVMMRWTTVPVPSTRETAREFACEIIPEGWREDREWAFAVDAPGDDGVPRFAGTVSLRNERHRRAEVAYGAHPWARGGGHVVRALELLLDWGFRERGLETVIWWANKGNWASRKVAWRLGFSFDGTVARWLPQRGELLDGWVGALGVGDERRPRHPWFDVPRIVGRTVVLREQRDSDAGRIAEACSDERTSYWLTRMPSPYTEETAREYVESRREQLATASGISWAVADPATDELLGNISVFDLSPDKDAEIGYWTHPAARGRGVMTEACGLVVRHAFVPEEEGGLGLHRLHIVAADGNTASQRVIEANCFRPVGRMREETLLRDGTRVDSLLYDLLAREYAGPPDAREAPPAPRTTPPSKRTQRDWVVTD